jgi:hypothetical protein
MEEKSEKGPKKHQHCSIVKYILKLKVPIFTGFEDWMADGGHDSNPCHQCLYPALFSCICCW